MMKLPAVSANEVLSSLMLLGTSEVLGMQPCNRLTSEGFYGVQGSSCFCLSHPWMALHGI